MQDCGSVAPSMFGHNKAFEKKLAISSKSLEEKNLKYFPLLIKHFEIAEEKNNVLKKCSSIIEDVKILLSQRFVQLQELCTTLQFIFFPHTIHFEDLNLSHFSWLDLDNLEMEIVDFQESIVWKIKFRIMNQKLEANELNPSMNNAKSIKSRTENTILAKWSTIPKAF